MATSEISDGGHNQPVQQLGGNHSFHPVDDRDDLAVSLARAIHERKSVEEVTRILDADENLLEAALPIKPPSGEEKYWPNVNPLAYSILMQNEPVIELLVQRNANMHAETSMPGGTVIHLFVACSPQAIVKRLIDHVANVNAQNASGMSPLHVAAMNNKDEVAALLLDSGAYSSLRDSTGSTAFHAAASKGSLSVLKLFWDRDITDYINEPNGQGVPPLHLACMGENTCETAEWLLGHGADIELIAHERGSLNRADATPLCYACLSNNTKTVEMLLKRGANLRPPGVTLPPILVACNRGHIDIFGLLVREGATIWDVGDGNNNCFHEIARSATQKSTVLELFMLQLLDIRSSINRVNNHFQTPLQLACIKQTSTSVELLIRYGANVNSITENGVTALMEACAHSDKDIVECLLKNGANMEVRNAYGQNALDLACICGQAQNVRVLINHGVKVTGPGLWNRTILAFLATWELPIQQKAHEVLRASQFGNFSSVHSTTRKERMDAALQILASKEYYPQDPISKRPFKEQFPQHTKDIEAFLQIGFDRYCNDSKQLEIVMFWAVFNGSVTLVNKCISHNQRVRNWRRGQVNWIQLASYNGNTEVAKLLLKVWIPDANDQDRAWLQAAAIVEENTRGDSPLSISIKCGQVDLENLYLERIKLLQYAEPHLVESNAETRDHVLEMLARFEMPGHEVILSGFLKKWFRNSDMKSGSTTLELAVMSSKPIVVWWLLSHGGYSSEAIKNAKKRVRDGNDEDSPGFLINKLLENPPPIIDHVVNPEKTHKFNSPASNANPESLSLRGTIIEIRTDGSMINLPRVEKTIKEIVYDEDPNKSMIDVYSGDWHQQGLRALKRKMMGDATQPGYFHNNSLSSHGQTGVGMAAEDVTSDDQAHCRESRKDLLRLRWIHLPTNELKIMHDLVSRLSSDAKRSEKDHMAVMKHLNGSWIEMAAGTDHHYMKPQCAHTILKREVPRSKDEPAHPVSNTLSSPCAAIYMPYLTMQDHLPNAHGSETGREDRTRQGHQEASARDNTVGFRDGRSPVHDPMTLDQFYYSALRDTKERDNDQVLSKYLRQHFPGIKNKILMVNQLWLWVIDEKTIITAAAEIGEPRIDDKWLGATEKGLHLHYQAVSRFLYNDETRQIEATGFFNEKALSASNEDTTPVCRGAIDVFRESIKEATDEEARLFQEFLGSLKTGDKKGKSVQKSTSRAPLGSESNQHSAKSSRYHVISSEAELLEKIRDIRDELHILKSLAECQEHVWNETSAVLPGVGLQSSRFLTPKDLKKDLVNLIYEAEEIDNKINTLLGLRQSELSRSQADHAARQANTVFVFTVMTVIFLPLSFLVSLLALDVSVFPHDSEGVKYKPEWLFPMLFGISAAVSIPAIMLANNIESLRMSWEKIVHSWNPWKDGIPNWMERRKQTESSEVYCA